jgi:hypothetical protein
MLPTAKTAKRMWYSVSTLSRQEHEISLATVRKIHAAACIPDINSLQDAYSALFRITRKPLAPMYSALRKCTPTFGENYVFSFHECMKYTAQIIVILNFPVVLC